jgi:hypothetical protein
MEKIMGKNTHNTVRELKDELDHVSGGRTMPNGKTDAIKAMGNYDKSSAFADWLHKYGL